MKIIVVIPCYNVKNCILSVISNIGKEVFRIYVVDDKCPEKSGEYVEKNCKDSRVFVIYNIENQGVGGAVMAGYQAAINDSADIIVKIDGDGQMDPSLISYLIAPILNGEADYTKGNRFFNLDKIGNMPIIRMFGNGMLSFLTKLSSGYWNIFDPTNGYTAIHGNICKLLSFDKISKRYFFETDILFRLNILRAVVVDVPMDASYGIEKSNLKIYRVIFEFLFKNIRNFIKRIFYNYYLRDMSIASFELPIGLLMILWGCIYGKDAWAKSFQSNVVTPAGTVMLAALPILLGVQLILAFLGYDISSVPTQPLHKRGYIKYKNK